MQFADTTGDADNFKTCGNQTSMRLANWCVYKGFPHVSHTSLLFKIEHFQAVQFVWISCLVRCCNCKQSGANFYFLHSHPHTVLICDPVMLHYAIRLHSEMNT